MGTSSNIEWTDHTFNPWQGCIKVSPGCQHCYAETLSKRWGRDIWGPGSKRVKTSEANWRKPLQWNRQAQAEGRRFKVFCASMADVFEDNDQLIDWRLELFELIKITPCLDWQILTKRPEVARHFFSLRSDFLLPNVWVGTSVEDQKRADERIPELLKIPAAVRFLSIEPLLGPVDLVTQGQIVPDGKNCAVCGDNDHQAFECHHRFDWVKALDWVIVGGESGPDARAFHLDWGRDLIKQCQAAGVAVFMKQLGSNQAKGDDLLYHSPAAFFGRFTKDKKGGDLTEWPEDLRIREFPETERRTLAPLRVLRSVAGQLEL